MARHVLVTIDPGMSGAIVVRDKRGVVRSYNMPDTIPGIRDLLKTFLHDGGVIIMEDVGYHVMGNNASSSAKFAKHTGVLIGLAYALIENGPVLVQPKKWMEHYGKMPKDKGQRKNALKQIAIKLFPKIKVTLANADALCMMGVVNKIALGEFEKIKEEYDRRKETCTRNTGRVARGKGTDGSDDSCQSGIQAGA